MYKEKRKQIDIKLKHITAMIGSVTENEIIKNLAILSENLLAKQDKPVCTCNEMSNHGLWCPTHSKTTKHLDKLVVPDKLEKIKKHDGAYFWNQEVPKLINKIIINQNKLIDFNKQLLISLKEIQK